MKCKIVSILTVLMVCLASARVFAQNSTSTPNIGLQIPPTGSNNWYIPLNYNFSRMDQFLSGSAPIPALNIQNNLVVHGSITAGNFVGVGGGSFPTISGTITPGNCAKWLTSTTLSSVTCGSSGGGGSSVTGGVWTSLTPYTPGSVVTYGGGVYVAIANSTGVTPGTNPSDWTLITGTVGGMWHTEIQYPAGSVVIFSGQTYVATQANSASQPDTSPTYWTVINSGSSDTPVGPANYLLAFNVGTSGTRTPGSTSLFNYDSGGSLDVPTTLSTGHIKVVQEHCAFDAIDSINGNVCEIHNNNTNSGGTASSSFQQTGAGRNSGPILGALYNVGWTHAQPYASAATFLTRGLHFMEGDAGLGMNCQSVGDCIYSYHYLNFIGGCCAPSDEAVKNLALINQEYKSFYHGSVSTITDNPTPGGVYPTGAHAITLVLNNGTGTNIVGDGTYLMGDPGVANTTACNLNGYPTQWSGTPGTDVGIIAVTGCTGAPLPAINAWGTASTNTDGGMIGDTIQSGQNGADTPVQQSFVITPGPGSGAFSAPDGTNSWSNFVCIRGGINSENARITSWNASTHTMTANVRYAHGFSVAIVQGPGCAPYQAMSVDDDLANSPQASSYISFGTPDGGAHIVYPNYLFFVRSNGDTPESTTSRVHFVPASEIVANAAPNIYSGSPQLRKEDNGWLPGPGTPVWNPHPVNNPSEVISAYDYTVQYNNSSYASGLFVSGASGPRVTGGYLVNSFINGNPYGMYRPWGGWATLPSRISGGGVFSSLLTNDRMPWDSLIFAGDWMPGQTQVNLFNVAGNNIILRKLPGQSGDKRETDFAPGNANSVRASYFTFPKVVPGRDGFGEGYHIGVCTTSYTVCIGTTVDTVGQITPDAAVSVGSITSNNIVVNSIADGCASWSFGALRSTGTPCGSGSGGSGGSGTISGQTTNYLLKATSATGSTTSSGLEDTGSQIIYHAGASAPSTHALLLPASATPAAPSAGNAVFASDSSGNAMASDNGGTLGRICTTTNGQCAGGSGGSVAPFDTVFDTSGSTPGTTFTLSKTPVFLIVSRNGVIQTPNVDYTISGAVITSTAIVTTGEIYRAQGF